MLKVVVLWLMTVHIYLRIRVMGLSISNKKKQLEHCYLQELDPTKHML